MSAATLVTGFPRIATTATLVTGFPRSVGNRQLSIGSLRCARVATCAQRGFPTLRGKPTERRTPLGIARAVA